MRGRIHICTSVHVKAAHAYSVQIYLANNGGLPLAVSCGLAWILPIALSSLAHTNRSCPEMLVALFILSFLSILSVVLANASQRLSIAYLHVLDYFNYLVFCGSVDLIIMCLLHELKLVVVLTK